MPNKNQNTRLAPLIMIVLGGLLILGVGGWYLSQMFQEADLPPTQAASLEDNYPDITRISLIDAKAAYDAGTAVFLDVRDAQSYAQRHIPGAVSISLTELPSRITELDPEDWIITY